jgi:hypothetical protein
MARLRALTGARRGPARPPPPCLGFAAPLPSLCNTLPTQVFPTPGDGSGARSGEDERHAKEGLRLRASQRNRSEYLDGPHGADRIGTMGFSTGSERIISASFRGRGRHAHRGVRPGRPGTRHRADGLPAGFEMVRRRSWSLLSIMAQGDTWFLDDALTRFFRTLHPRPFSRFSRVIFYGVGPDCGFAACAYARFAPGARFWRRAPWPRSTPRARRSSGVIAAPGACPSRARWASARGHRDGRTGADPL